MTGKFIVLYGINNLGKSTQAKLLTETLNNTGEKAVYIKYPVYDLAPSGPFINSYLREGNPHNFSAREAQMLYILNRTQYQKTLEKILEEGAHVVAEDYTGTGIAWGMAAGIDRAILEKMNEHLRNPDIAVLFTGKRFVSGKEDGHLHESDDVFTTKTAEAFEALGAAHLWYKIEANRTKEEVHAELFSYIQSALKK